MWEGVDYLLSPPTIFSQKTKQKLITIKKNQDYEGN